MIKRYKEVLDNLVDPVKGFWVFFLCTSSVVLFLTILHTIGLNVISAVEAKVPAQQIVVKDVSLKKNF